MFSVTPAGIVLLICAVMVYDPDAGLLQVYVVTALVTEFGAEPAVAVEIVIWAGEPDTLSCARASLDPSTATATTAVRIILLRVRAVADMVSSEKL
jgi:hypothetical protein